MKIQELFKKRRCCLCGEWETGLKKIVGSDLNKVFFDTLYFHDDCLMQVSCNPRQYSSKIINTAIVLVEAIKNEKQYQDWFEKIKSEQVKRLHEFVDLREKDAAN